MDLDLMAAAAAARPRQFGLLLHNNHWVYHDGDGTAADTFAELQALLLARTAQTDDDNDDDEKKKKAAVWYAPGRFDNSETFLHYCARTNLPSRHWEWILEHCPAAVVSTTLSSSSSPLSLSPLVAIQTALIGPPME
jgi:hypothetical protein